jgi:hypothetical protein
MKPGSILATILKGKVLAAIFVSTVAVGGATAAFASTPAGQTFVHQMTAASTTTPTASTDHQGKDEPGTATPGATKHGKSQKHDQNQQCPGLPEVQRLATYYSLSTESQSDDVQAICSLHDGNFKGTTTNGKTVSTSTVYGYGEISQLLTYAQFLTSHGTGNMSGKLTSNNVRTYLADALYSCGTTPLAVCLKTNIPNTHPGNSDNTGNGNNNNTGNGQHLGNGNSDNTNDGKGQYPGNGKGRPSSTPTPIY